MNSTNKLKIFNDPIYGFITIPNGLIYDLIQHPYFQRLRRISQMGLSYLVYPGAHHTRFHHALGCMHIMQKAVQTLRFKGVLISDEEENALYIAILLHDIGHGPFSHAMEHSIVEDIHHEAISLLFMNALNTEFNGKLSLAIQIFKGEYHRKFMLQLISSQLDMDRMDYLKRDSFYSGVAEGNINSDRLIQMMNVQDDILVIEEKGIFSVEKFLVARRLMYWQAYLHKTSVVAELTLTKILKRAKELTQKGIQLPCSEPLSYFLNNKISTDDFDAIALKTFALLDDYDVMGAIKSWQFNDDFVLSSLSKMIINRDLLKITMLDEKPNSEKLDELKDKITTLYHLSDKEAAYFVFKGKLKNQAYNKESEPISILKKDKTVENIVDSTDQLQVKALSKAVTKYFICYPKVLLEA
ncbi:HD domain-containing protein [Flavobacterium sp.]|uniref:HD domain-containing protein n=1 Tax=Flavobacterium sp. TaxID=239 RepID=UPI002605B5CD|nr:HD domain-containing protein [Flavobacterium sp.]